MPTPFHLQGKIQLFSAAAVSGAVASTPVFKFVKPEEAVKCALAAVLRLLPAHSPPRARRFKGLSHEEMLVFQLTQQSGNKGAPLCAPLLETMPFLNAYCFSRNLDQGLEEHEQPAAASGACVHPAPPRCSDVACRSISASRR